MKTCLFVALAILFLFGCNCSTQDCNKEFVAFKFASNSDSTIEKVICLDTSLYYFMTISRSCYMFDSEIGENTIQLCLHGQKKGNYINEISSDTIVMLSNNRKIPVYNLAYIYKSFKDISIILGDGLEILVDTTTGEIVDMVSSQ